MKRMWMMAGVAGMALLGLAPQAAAQSAEVKVRIDPRIVHDIRVAVRDIVPEIQHEIRSATRQVTRDVSHAMRDVSNVIRDLGLQRWIDLDLDFDFDFDLDIDADWKGWQRGGQNFRETETKRDTRTFALGADGQLDLESLSGDIVVTAGSGREATVEIVKVSRARTAADARLGLDRVTVEVVERGTRASLKARYPSGRQPSFSVSVNYTVTVPAGTRVSASTLSGDVSASGVHGDLSMSTMSGDVSITNARRITIAKTASGDVRILNSDIDGTLQAETMSGTVHVEQVKAQRLTLGTVSGDVEALGVTAGTVTMSTMSGSVEYSGGLSAGGRYEFKTHSGDVRLILDGRTGFRFEGSSFNGQIRSDLPLSGAQNGQNLTSSRNRTVVGWRNRSLNGTFGDGSALIEATSFNGTVSIVKR